ncbi:MAG TPA: pyridoxal-phosphate dependent enzyme, partial [Trueperaceae bacterium]|nr:pyridoxal-phosphate dependent enzyme [Trueperaceae bacterium]
DGTAGGVEAGSVTFPIIQELVDDFVTVTEDEIKQELKEFIDSHFMLMEGAAAVTIAAYKKFRNNIKAKNVVLVMCGGKISTETLKEVL